MSDDIKNLIRSAMEKDADAFETNFDTALTPKLDAALTAKYDEMFGSVKVEEDAEIDAEIDEETISEDTHHGRDAHNDTIGATGSVNKAYDHVKSALTKAKSAGMKINHTHYGDDGKPKTTALGGGKAHAKPHMTTYTEVGAEKDHFGYTLHKGAPKVKGVGDAHKTSKKGMFNEDKDENI